MKQKIAFFAVSVILFCCYGGLLPAYSGYVSNLLIENEFIRGDFEFEARFEGALETIQVSGGRFRLLR